MNEATEEKQLYATLSTIKKSQSEIGDAIDAGENIMNKISPRPSDKKLELSEDESGKREASRTLLEELSNISSNNRKLTSRLNNFITWMDKTF